MKNKKIISAVTALMLTASLMAGCSDKPADENSSAADNSSAAATTTAAEKETTPEETTAEEDTTDAETTEDENGMKVVDLSNGDTIADNMRMTSLSSVERGSLRTTSNTRANVSTSGKARKWSDKKKEDKKKLTIMVYMVGSDLESKQASKAATVDIGEMIYSGLDDKDVNLVVYCGGAQTWWIPGYPSGKNAYIEYKSKDADIQGDNGAGITIYETDKKNMGKSETFSEFLKDAPSKYPADEYALICWDHGGGPVLGYGSDELNVDSKTKLGDSLTLAEMKTALEKSDFKKNKLKFVGFDACVMSSIEIADLWQNYAEYLVASADSEPGCGWNYEFLKDVKGTTDTPKICKNIIKTYFDYLSEVSSHCYISDATLAAFDLSKTDKVKDAVGGVCKAMNDDLQTGDTRSYDKFLNGVHSYASFDLADLGTMVTSLSSTYTDETKKLKSAMNDMLIDGTTTIANTCGMSLYFPLSNSTADLDTSLVILNYLGGSDYIQNTPINAEYKALMNTLLSETSGGTSSSTSKPDNSSSKKESNSSSKTESSSSKKEESSSSKKEESSSSKAESSSSKKDDSSSKPDSSTGTANSNSSLAKLDLEVVEKGAKSSNKDYKDDGYAYSQLPKEEIKNIRGVYYTVLKNVAISDGDKNWAPYVIYIPAEVDDKGIAKMDLDPTLIGVVTDKEAEPNLCPTKFLGNGSYRSSGSLSSTRDLSDEYLYVNITSNVDKKGNAAITGITANLSSSSGMPITSKDDIDLSEWLAFESPIVSYIPDEKEPRKHYSEGKEGLMGGEFSLLGDNFDVKACKPSEIAGEYAVQMSVFTIDGKEYCSNIGCWTIKDGNTEKLKEQKVDKGVLKFAILDDHAELVKFEKKGKEETKKLTVPDKVDGKKVTVVRSGAFAGTNPEEIVFPDSVEYIGRLSSGSTTTKKITLPKKLKTIPDSMFSYYKDLESIEIPSTVESIGAFAFESTGLKEIKIPKSVTSIGDGVFSNCTALDKITVESGNKNYTADANVLYTADKKKLIAFTGMAHEEFIVPEGVTEIGRYAFTGSYEKGLTIGKTEGEEKGLKKITFPKTLVKIGDYAFEGCTGFKEIVLPDSLEYIGAGAFGISLMQNTSDLAELKFGPSVRRIRTCAFSGYKIKKITVDPKNTCFKSNGTQLTSIDGSSVIKLTK
ncbi:clostripain-related cysteine peptidase [Ruminococcus albus]|uniref:Leucine rich repeat-containing protein n=1 Tax=Ruminococcus albus TaxID=1264 RepID=A0A1H7NAU1_RUMAL|nr:clostripain-related cysteine peptidase [Ruminococcus albus]SEL20065.1 Leucine rich repeat-containing protein [Ruminococcus albus]